MKLVIQIPAYNEQDCISEVLKSIPKNIKGIDEIKIIVLDDCSFDGTSKIANEFGVEVCKNSTNLGLSYTFLAGIKKALEYKADILVNLDGDNQYCADDIEKLIQPIINNNFGFHFSCNQCKHKHYDVQSTDYDKYSGPTERVFHEAKHNGLNVGTHINRPVEYTDNG